ncbi:MAG TPA: methylated-DNA--[protein]-cysteine S-methyltransferase [Gemmatimonadales bacterium]|nr:methylated-DNA--[protein]-cysteine S-methyltransferase [Gemmatimonadales bacterium]
MVGHISYCIARCSLGFILIARTDSGICAISLGDEPTNLRQDLERRFPEATLRVVQVTKDTLLGRALALVESPQEKGVVPLDFHGTPFQKRVWQALRDIGPGYTTTYAGIAARIGAPRAVRAVARACAANPIAVAIPCHRVIRSDGAISGYRWGIHRKQALLEREAVA